MKKNAFIIGFVILLLFVAVLVSCSTEDNIQKTPIATQSGPQSTASIPGKTAESSPGMTENLDETQTSTITATPDATANPTGTTTPDSTVSPSPTSTPTPTPTPKPTPKPTPTPTEKPADSSPKVTFSKEGGVYTDAFELTLSANPGYSIYYTTDGTDPQTSKTRITYTAPIQIKASTNKKPGPLTTATTSALGYVNPSAQIVGTSIKAVAVKNGIPTPVVTNTYYVGSKLTSTYNMPFVSITTKKEDFTTKTGIYVTVMQHPFAKKERIVAHVEMFDEKGVKQSGQYVELCMSGNGSLGNSMKSMRLYFKKDANPSVTNNPGKLKYDIFNGNVKDSTGRVIDSFDRILLRNSGNDCAETMFRDAFMQKVSEPLNVDYMESRPILVFVNGECWGMYNARERYDDKYFNAHYGILEENIAMLEAPSPLVTGTNSHPFEVNEGVEGDQKDWEELVSYAQSHNLANQTYFDHVASKVDIDNMIDYFIVNMYFGNGDWPGNNVKVWRNKNPKDPSGFDTKWRFVLLDLDFGCANNYTSNTVVNALNSDAIIIRLFKACLNNEAFKMKFYDRFIYVMDNYYVESEMIELIDSMQAQRAAGISLNAQRWPTLGTSVSKFNSEVEEMRGFVRNRKQYIKEFLVSSLNITANEITINYQPENVSVKMNGSSVPGGYTKECGKNETVTIEATVKSGYIFTGFAVTYADGSQKIFSENKLELSVKSRTTVTVLAKKNVSTTPKVVAASSTIFYLTENGNLYAWGDNTQRQCACVTSSILKASLIATNVLDVATSQGGNVGTAPHTLILTHDGTVYSFGNNSNGQLGRNSDAFALLPVDLPAVNSKVVGISAGHDHSLILFENGELYGIGNNTNGQLGTTNMGGSVNKFIKLADNVTSMAAGRRHTIFVRDSKAYAIGDNRWYKLSTSSESVITTPVKILDNAKKVVAGEHSSFIIDNNNDLYYIGWRSTSTYVTGQGDGKVHKLLSNVKSVSMQDEHALIVTIDNKCYGVGLNTYRQACLSNTNTQSTPAYISSDIVSAAAGSWFSVTLDTKGNIVVWGKNAAAITGDGNVSDSVGRTTLSTDLFD